MMKLLIGSMQEEREDTEFYLVSCCYTCRMHHSTVDAQCLPGGSQGLQFHSDGGCGVPFSLDPSLFTSLGVSSLGIAYSVSYGWFTTG